MDEDVFFSDRELPDKKTKLGEEITYTVWGGIYTIYCKYLANNNFAKDFPLNCPDGNGIYGVDRHLLEISAKSLIPNLPDDINEYFRVEELNPFLQIDLEEEKVASWREKKEQYKMTVLDFVEFLCLHICDVENGNYHSFFNHYELNFKCTNNAREQFIQEINLLFRRNELAFLLDDGGRIRRVLPYAISDSIVHRPTLNDITTNELIREAESLIILPKIGDRKIAVDRLWDAFERLKTLHHGDKKASIEAILKKAANGNDEMFERLSKECHELTEIGDKFQIRHFEKGTFKVDSPLQIDYLFFRMYATIIMLINSLKNI